jgi:hypothetical protein
MSQPDQAAIDAFTAFQAARAAFAAPGAGNAEGNTLMDAYAVIDRLDGTTPEGAAAKLAVGLYQAAVACPLEESGIDFEALTGLLYQIIPPAIRAAL